MEKKPQNKEKIDLFYDRLQTLIRAVSHRTDLKVVRTMDSRDQASMAMRGINPDQAWFYDPIGDRVHVPIEMTQIPESEALGKASHEASHVAITRIHKIAPLGIESELGLTSLLMAIEERPTDQYVREYTPGAGEWLDEARKGSMREGDEARQKLGSARKEPKFLQLNNLIVYGRFDNKRKWIDRDVSDVYEKIKSVITEIEHTLPSYQASEPEIMDRARERFARSCTEVWPQIQSLLDKDKEFQEMREMIKQDEILQMIIERLAQDLQKELQKILLDEKSKETKESKSDSQDGEDPDKTGDPSGESSGDPKNATEISSDGTPSESVSEMSEGLRKALRDAFNALPEEKKQEMRDQAQKKLRGKEKEQIDELKSKMDANSEAEQRQDTDSEKQIQEKDDVDKDDTARKIFATSISDAPVFSSQQREDLEQYNREYQEVNEYTEILYRRLSEIFHPNIKSNMQLRSVGSKLNLKAIYRNTSQREGGARNVDNKIFEVTHFPEPRDYAVTLLVDLSGSMQSGGKIDAAYKGSIILAEALGRLGVKLEILGFQDKVIIFKDFDMDFSDQIRSKVPSMVREVYDTNPGGNNAARWNDDGPCLKEASERLDRQQSKNKILIVISDGTPKGRRSGSEDLREAIADIKRTDQNLVAIGLGEGTGHVTSYYGRNAKANVAVPDMPSELSNLLFDMIQNPSAFK